MSTEQSEHEEQATPDTTGQEAVDQGQSTNQADTPEAKDENGDKKETKAAQETVKRPVPEKLKEGRKNDWIQSRISHYAAETRQAREENARIRQELEQLKQGTTSRRDPSQAPNPDEFQKYDDYVDALVDWKVGQKEAANRKQYEQQGAMASQHQRQQAFNQHLQTFASAYEDPNAVMQAMFDEQIPVNDIMADAIMDLGEQGPEVLLYLAQNPADAMTISRMAPRMATMQIGILSRQISGQAAAPAQAQPSIPQVQPKAVPQVRGSSPGAVGDVAPNDKEDITTWAKKEFERMRKTNPNLRAYVPRG